MLAAAALSRPHETVLARIDPPQDEHPATAGPVDRTRPAAVLPQVMTSTNPSTPELRPQRQRRNRAATSSSRARGDSDQERAPVSGDRAVQEFPVDRSGR